MKSPDKTAKVSTEPLRFSNNMKTLILSFLLTTSALAVDPFSTNAFIFGDVETNGGHSDGSIVVGGNWSGSSYEIRQHSNTPAINGNGLILGGDNNVSQYLRVLNGNALYEGAQGNLSTNVGTKTHGNVDLTSEIQGLYSLLSSLYGLSGVEINTSGMNNITMSAAANTLNGHLKVFAIDSTEITGNRTLSFSGLTSLDLVLINVTGDSVNWNWSVNNNASQLLWNFGDTTALNVDSREFTGTILAPLAHVDQRQNINGTLIADSWTVYGSTELHSRPLENIELVNIPEPSAAFLIALTGVAWILKRRTR